MRLSRADREELGVVEPFWQAQLAVLFALLLYLVFWEVDRGGPHIRTKSPNRRLRTSSFRR